MTLLKEKFPAITAGIKAVGVGKKGSKDLTPELIDAIIVELKHGSVPAIAKGAFFGALVMKGVSVEEQKLDQLFDEPGTLLDPRRLSQTIGCDAPVIFQWLAQSLLEKETLDSQYAHHLGTYLFDDENGEGLRGLAASIMRVRYETDSEYQGLLQAMEETCVLDFDQPPTVTKPIIQLAEPFDGVDHSNLITPLIANHLQSRGFCVVSLCGRNSGPKFGNNLLNVAQGLDAKLVKSNQQITDTPVPFGHYIHQKDLSPAIDAWVERRQAIIKRPFLATLERFVNPTKADTIIASAFHPPYADKMATICERAGFKNIIIIRNGLEGTMAFAMMRPVKILVSRQKSNETYTREEFDFDVAKELNINVNIEERLEQPSLEKNIALIREYAKEGTTSYALFNHRVRATCAGIDQAFNRIKGIEQTT